MNNWEQRGSRYYWVQGDWEFMAAPKGRGWDYFTKHRGDERWEFVSHGPGPDLVDLRGCWV